MINYLNIGLSIVKNKYWVTLIAFLVWVTFFDSNSFVNQYKISRTLAQMRAEKKFYTEEIKKDQQTADGLIFNLDNLEKLAREKYYMSRNNEEVFLIIEETEDQRENRLGQEEAN